MVPVSKRHKKLTEAEKEVGAVWRRFKDSAQPVLDVGALETVKARVRTGQVAQVQEALWHNLRSAKARQRLCSLLICHELFLRSVEFRKLVVQNFVSLCDLCLGTDANAPLPDPQKEGVVLRERAIAIVQEWYQRFVASLPQLPSSTMDYRRQLSMACSYLQEKKGISIRQQNQQERVPPAAAANQDVGLEARVAASAFEESEGTISRNLLIIENGLAALMPSFEEQYNLDEAMLLQVESLTSTANQESEQDEWEEEEDEEKEQVDRKESGLVAQTLDGFFSNYEISVAVQTQVDKTSENAPLIDVIRESSRVLQERHIPLLAQWRIYLEQVPDKRQRIDALLERADAVKRTIEGLLQKAK